MIRATACFVAEGVTTDRDNGQVSAYHLLESVEAPAYPLYLQRLAFVCFWERTAADPARCHAEFSVTLDGGDLLRQPVDVDFGSSLHNRCTCRLDGLSLPRPGTIAFRLAIAVHGTAEWTVDAAAVEVLPDAGAGTSSAAQPMWRSDTITMTSVSPNPTRR